MTTPRSSRPSIDPEAAKIAKKLAGYGLSERHVVVRAAKHGLIKKACCEIPGCPRPERFDSLKRGTGDWTPTADHFPNLKRHGGRLLLTNVRLAHKKCNRDDSFPRAFADELIQLFGAANAQIMLELVSKPGSGRQMLLGAEPSYDEASRLRLVEALREELRRASSAG